MSVRILEGDCLSVMPTLDVDSIDAIITDPPYHLTTGKKGGTGVASLNVNSPAGRSRVGTGFMGKAWDGGDVAFRPETWTGVLRVAKPGAHLVAFGGTRTYHRLTCAIEDAGWEIRDCLSWLYGSGFPKSHNGVWGGTALKPAWEPIILARKPLAGTVAGTTERFGTGALNIDASRLGGEPWVRPKTDNPAPCFQNAFAQDKWTRENMMKGKPERGNDLGRWPANVLLDEEAAALLDEQSGELKAGWSGGSDKIGMFQQGIKFTDPHPGYGGGGGASRFFYTAKASRSEREAGLEGHSAKVTNTDTPPGTKGSDSPRAGTNRSNAARNHHPTVKPLDLMQWLCRLVTPKGGLILDPFCGSGSTGRAAVAEGFSFIGIELDPEYATIARARITEYAPLFGDVA